MSFAEKAGIAIPLLSDPKLEIISKYRVTMEGSDIAVPATVIIDQNKQVSWKLVSNDIRNRPSTDKILEQAKAAKR